MFSTLDDSDFFSQKITILKKYSNIELKLIEYFRRKTKVYPMGIVIINNFIFFLISNRFYFKTKLFLGSIRKELRNNKVMIIRSESTLLKLIYSFFPDPYVHDIKLEKTERIGTIMVNVHFLSFKERGIAIGRKGGYIKAVNEFFKKKVVLEKLKDRIIIKCKLIDL